MLPVVGQPLRLHLFDLSHYFGLSLTIVVVSAMPFTTIDVPGEGITKAAAAVCPPHVMIGVLGCGFWLSSAKVWDATAVHFWGILKHFEYFEALSF